MDAGLSLVERAARIMVTAHDGQVRKVGGSPYIIHTTVVALTVASHGFSEAAVAAALVHDVLEDTDYSETKLVEELGDEVVAIVRAVTEDKTLAWEARKAAYVQSIRIAAPEAKAVSIADKIHNLRSILVAHGAMGTVVWGGFTRGRQQQLELATQLLDAYRSSWQHPLVDEYAELVHKVQTLD